MSDAEGKNGVAVAQEVAEQAAASARFRFMAQHLQKAAQKTGASPLETTAVLLSMAGQFAAMCGVSPAEAAQNMLAAWQHKKAQMAEDRQRVKVPTPVIVGPDGGGPVA